MATSRQLSYNVYDGILKSRNLPYLPDFRTSGHSTRAIDLMNTAVIGQRWYLTHQTTYRRLAKVLTETPSIPYLAVVDSDGTAPPLAPIQLMGTHLDG